MIRRHCVLAALAIAAVSLAGGTHAAFAADKVCKLEISGNDAMQYDKKELDVASDCTEVELTLSDSTVVGQRPGHDVPQHRPVLLHRPRPMAPRTACSTRATWR